MKALVIGGAGYIGSHVVKELCEEKHEVTVFDNLSTGCVSNLHKKAKLVKGDILDKRKTDAVMKQGFDAVFHFAALKAAGASMNHPEEYSEVNLIGTINVLNAMCRHKVTNIVFSSSAAVYGSPKYNPMDEKHPLVPENYYGFTKEEIERILAWYAKLKGMRYACLRYFNAAGYDIHGIIKGKEKDPANLLPIVMEVASGVRKELTVHGNDYHTDDGSCIRDYIHVSDLADAHIKAMAHIIEKKESITVNLGAGKGYSVLQVIERAKAITGKEIKYKIGPKRPGDPAVSIASSDLAYRLLGWRARHSDIDTILKSMWAVYSK